MDSRDREGNIVPDDGTQGRILKALCRVASTSAAILLTDG